MPQPAASTQVADELAALWREAQDSLQQQLAQALTDPNRASQQARLRALATTAREVRGQLEAGTRTWLSTRLPQVHALGGQAAATAVGSQFAWTQPHLEAIQELAASTWTDVAANLQGLEGTTVKAIRELTRASAREALLEGATAAQAGRDLETWMARRGIAAVTYSNGARHLAGDYADTLSRTVTANAYNKGTFTQCREDGFGWVEVSDGPACGWTSHQDPDKANGTVRSLEDAEAHPISHPRCARSFSPAPTVTNQDQADAARRFTGTEQAVMAAEENLRAASATTTLSGRSRGAGRAPRTVRTPKAPRTARTATQVAAPAAPASTNPPVSAAIQVSNRSTAAPAAYDALAAVDSVHSDGILPATTLNGNMTLDRSALGYFQPGVPHIAVSATGPWPRLTATHEIGHLLDNRGIPGAGYTSLTAHQTNNPMHDWWQAIRGTDAYRELLAAPVNRTTQYLLQPYELWARSYAQYIAEVAGDPVLARELQVSLAYQARGQMPRQWVGGDFDPVRDSITRLLASLGWTP